MLFVKKRPSKPAHWIHRHWNRPKNWPATASCHTTGHSWCPDRPLEQHTGVALKPTHAAQPQQAGNTGTPHGNQTHIHHLGLERQRLGERAGRSRGAYWAPETRSGLRTVMTAWTG